MSDRAGVGKSSKKIQIGIVRVIVICPALSFLYAIRVPPRYTDTHQPAAFCVETSPVVTIFCPDLTVLRTFAGILGEVWKLPGAQVIEERVLVDTVIRVYLETVIPVAS